jgi:MFS family permease
LSGPAPAPGRADALDRDGLRRVTTVLCVTEITSWGVLYYAFPVLATRIADDTGWSLTSVVAAFTASQVVAALVGIPVGRWLDVRGPRQVMTAGSVLAVPAVVAISLAPTLAWFVAGWTLAGVAMSCVLYPPAFAALTRWGGEHRVAPLTALTLVAGLASTVFAPLTAVLAHQVDWRHTYQLLAVVLALTVPAHLLGLRGPWHPHRHAPREAGTDPVWATRPFVLLAVAMSAVALCAYGALVNLVPLLVERGFTTGTAALVLGLGGVGQVCGRLGYRRLTARTTTTTRTALVFGYMAVTTAALALVPGPLGVLAVLSFVVGAGRGVFTLIQATAVSDRWGTHGFGRLNGILSGPVLLTAAVGPWAGATVAAALGGQPEAFLLLAGLAALATLLVPLTVPRRSVG